MRHPVRTLALAAAALTVSACSGPTAPEGFEFIIQVRAVSQPDAPTAQVAPARAPDVASVEIREAVVVFGGFRMERENDPTPFVLDQSVVIPLQLSGDPTLVYRPNIPDGRYVAIELFVDELEPEVPREATLIDVFPRLDGISVLIAGTLQRNGVTEPFTYTSRIESDARLQFPRARSFDEESAALAVYTIRLDMDRWFRTLGGDPLDPADEADASAIDASIIESMQLVEGGGA